MVKLYGLFSINYIKNNIPIKEKHPFAFKNYNITLKRELNLTISLLKKKYIGIKHWLKWEFQPQVFP